MPNWCFTSALFKGKPENIIKLRNDIQEATEWHRNNPYFCNMRHLLNESNFDTVSYIQRYSNRYQTPSFRGSAFDNGTSLEECKDGDLLYHASFEMAWNMDYEVLHIISRIYDVEFSAHSEEPGMDIYTKCAKGETLQEYSQKYDVDIIIKPDAEQFEQALGECDYQLDFDYENPVNSGSDEEKHILDQINNLGLEYQIETFEECPLPNIYGVYYHYIYGVDYDDDIHKNFYKYPGIDRFNIINK